jgi:hypothetical protein
LATFGTEETITCIQHVKATGPDGEPLCLAFKTTKTFIFAGVHLSDDGYVLAIERDGGGTVDRFFNVPAEELARLQGLGLVPQPLPKYSIPWFEYAFGYSLWICLVFGVLMTLLARVAKKRRAERYAAELASTPPSHGPPVVITEADRYIGDQLRSQLAPGEKIEHQAYTLDRPFEGSAIAVAGLHAYFAALSSRRLYLMKTRPGAFKILLENQGVEAIDRARITAVAVDDFTIVLGLDDGSSRVLLVPRNNKLSNQSAFLRDVPRLLQPAPVAAAL